MEPDVPPMSTAADAIRHAVCYRALRRTITVFIPHSLRKTWS